MDRRFFLKTAGGAGTAALMAKAATAAPAALPAHTTPFFVLGSASGGWDVSQFCDPKSGPDFPINNFTSANYVQLGPFTVGPGSTGALQFFQRYYKQLMVVNGMYAETNAHDIGAHYFLAS